MQGSGASAAAAAAANFDGALPNHDTHHPSRHAFVWPTCPHFSSSSAWGTDGSTGNHATFESQLACGVASPVIRSRIILIACMHIKNKLPFFFLGFSDFEEGGEEGERRRQEMEFEGDDRSNDVYGERSARSEMRERGKKVKKKA